MNYLIIRFLILAFAIYLVSKASRLFYVADFFTALIAAVLLAVVNIVVRPVLIVLTLPFTLITLGIFIFFINGFCLMLVSKLIPKFEIEGCFSATAAALLISIVTMLLELLLV